MEALLKTGLDLFAIGRNLFARIHISDLFAIETIEGNVP